MYQQLIDKLIYLISRTRQDIIFIIGLFNRYNINLKQDYLQVGKKVVWDFCRIL